MFFIGHKLALRSVLGSDLLPTIQQCTQQLDGLRKRLLGLVKISVLKPMQNVGIKLLKVSGNFTPGPQIKRLGQLREDIRGPRYFHGPPRDVPLGQSLSGRLNRVNCSPVKHRNQHHRVRRIHLALEVCVL